MSGLQYENIQRSFSVQRTMWSVLVGPLALKTCDRRGIAAPTNGSSSTVQREKYTFYQPEPT